MMVILPATKRSLVVIVFGLYHTIKLCAGDDYDESACEEESRPGSQEGYFDDILQPTGQQLYGKGPLGIDAVNYGICGKFAYMRDVYSREKAFGCRKRFRREIVDGEQISDQHDEEDEFDGQLDDELTNSTSNDRTPIHRIAGGVLAYSGEFPSHVQFDIQHAGGHSFCSGTLIHSNLVITVAHCVVKASSIRAFFGTTNQYGSDGQMIPAAQWCWHGKYANRAGLASGYDLAMVRLVRPVRYMPGKIEPACLKLQTRHASNSACAAAGFGRFSRSSALSDRLKTITIRRTCSWNVDGTSRSCYTGDYTGGACPGDSGSGIYCFDRCGGNRGTRTYVVAAVSGGDTDMCEPNSPKQFYAADFNWMADGVRNLIKVLKNGSAQQNLVRCRFSWS